MLARHWPEYAMEAAELGAFMVSAALVTVIVEYPASPVRQAVGDPFARRLLIGIAMGLTAIAIIYSPWGRQSGAHFNPAVTLTFLRLGKIEPWDATFYVVAQLTGAVAGVMLAAAAVGPTISDRTVRYVVTVPGPAGSWVAFGAELTISFVLMMTVLMTTNTPKVERFTGLFVGVLVALFIAIESPLSGMSMNPARTIGSAIPAHDATALWVYVTAPALGMLLAAEAYLRLVGRRVRSAKLRHDATKHCIFHCDHHAGKPQQAEARI